MVSIANKTLNNYIENLDESTKKDLFHVIASKNEELETEFESLKESTVSKLKEVLLKEEDSSIKSKITETIEKIESEKFDQINYVRLRKLDESILLDS
jgi:Txe/YoeB family toxin of Txe-Axe toxin-antitoxin module